MILVSDHGHRDSPQGPRTENDCNGAPPVCIAPPSLLANSTHMIPCTHTSMGIAASASAGLLARQSCAVSPPGRLGTSSEKTRSMGPPGGRLHPQATHTHHRHTHPVNGWRHHSLLLSLLHVECLEASPPVHAMHQWWTAQGDHGAPCCVSCRLHKPAQSAGAAGWPTSLKRRSMSSMRNQQHSQHASRRLGLTPCKLHAAANATAQGLCKETHTHTKGVPRTHTKGVPRT